MSKEVKIGILTILAISFAFWGYKYVQGNNLLSSSNTYYAFYQNVSGVTVGTPVTISGMGVGSVSKIELDQIERRVKMFFNINSEVNIPRETKATIVSLSMLGEMAIELSYDQACGEGTGIACANIDSELTGVAVAGLIEGMLGLGPEGPGLGEQVGGAVENVNETLFGDDSDHVIARTMRQLEATMANMNQATNGLNRLLASNSSSINQTMRSFAELANTLTESQEALKGIIDNTQQFTSNLGEVELQSTLDNANEMIQGLQTTLAEANASLGGLSGVMTAIQNGEGTLGQLIYDDEIYAGLQRMSASLDTLATDFAERPYRYIPFKSRNRVLRFDRRDENRADEIFMLSENR